MDPLSLIGGISAAGAIIAAIATTVQNLYDIRGRYDEADLTIRLLIVELNTIKAALIQIQDWAQYSFAGSPTQKELLEGFEVSLEGCKMAMDVFGGRSGTPSLKEPLHTTHAICLECGGDEGTSGSTTFAGSGIAALASGRPLVSLCFFRERVFFLTSHLIQSNRYSAKIAAAAPGKPQDYPEGHRRHILATGNDPWLSQQSSNHRQSP
jgi:hypothetical protein